MASWVPLSSPSGATEFDRVFGLRANLYAHYRDFYARLWEPSVLDTITTELCRLRVAQLLRCRSQLRTRSRPALDAGLTEATVTALASWPTSESFDDTVRACLGLVEQFVIDPSGVRAADRAAVHGALGFSGLVGLTQVAACFDGFDRFRLVLGLDDAAPIDASGAPVVEEVGRPDPSVPPVAARTGNDPAGGFAAAQPDLFASFERLYAALWSAGVVDHPSKELARLRNARVTGCRFCRNVRFERARRDGLSEAMVDLVTDGYEASTLSDAHKAVLALADAFLTDPWGGPDTATRHALLEHYGPEGVVELVAGLALFVGFSKIAVALDAFPDDFPTTVIPTPGEHRATR